jgi:hypothetical protein
MSEATILILRSPSTPSREVPLALSGYPKEVGGFPAFYARKEILKCGEYVHPSTGLKFSITTDRMDGLVRTFKQMNDRGQKVFLPGKHRDYDAKDNFGWAVAMERQGDSLFAVEQLIGEDARLAAARNDRSVMIRPKFKDEKGTEYAEAIEHIAIVPDPVISGLSGTVPIAASKSSPATEALVLELAAQQEIRMDLSKLREALGAAKDVPDETVIQQATAKLAAVPALETDKATALSRATAAEAERDAAKAQVLELSRTGSGPDPEVLHERGLRIMDKADSLSAAGILPPAFVDKFKKLLGGDKPRALLLSRDTGAADCPAGEFINLLAEFKPVMQFGEKTGAQQKLELARQAHGNAGEVGADDKPITPDRLKEILSLTPLGNDILATAAAK